MNRIQDVHIVHGVNPNQAKTISILNVTAAVTSAILCGSSALSQHHVCMSSAHAHCG